MNNTTQAIMKLQALASVAVLLCTGFVSAMPNQQWDDSCFKCEYKYDDCGKEYGGYEISLFRYPSSIASIAAHHNSPLSFFITLFWYRY